MTRKEEREHAAYDFVSIEYSSPYTNFIQGAEWADYTMLDKVCEWLENHNDYQRVLDNGKGVRFDMTQCVFDLRKAMEE